MPEGEIGSSGGAGGSILQLKVRLLDVNPMVWRRVLVPAAMTLKELHGAFQVVLGWRSLHLYRFRIHAVHYGSWELGAEGPVRTLCSFNFRRSDQPHLLDDDEIRGRLEDVVERNRACEPFWPGRFDRRSVNTRLRAGEHHVLKHQQLC
jgi:hypothetical protein